MKISEKEIAKLQADRDESLNAMAEKWLSDNPITHPLGDYFKRVFIEAYTLGEDIIDI